jgi:putative ABC transport system ATP-binding protein
MLEIRNLSKSYIRRGVKFFAADNINFTLGESDFAVITGHSGSGKSTLLNMLAGLFKPDCGEIIFGGVDLTKLTADETARLRGSKIGYVPQGDTLLYNFTVIENILIPSKLSGIKQHNPAVLLEKAGIAHIANELPRNLSGGEARRAAIARSLITKPELLIADEPTNGLDPENSAAVLQLFRDANQGGATVIIVTHDQEAASAASKHLTMQNGKLSI